MTCIVGLVDGNRVFMGGDSAGLSGYSITTRADTKVFTKGAYAMGFTSSFRMGQLLHHALVLPEPPPHETDLERFMVVDVVDAIRSCLKAGGFATKESEAEHGGTFMVGIAGRLFTIGSDYQVGEPLDGYDAIGCGQDIALGALHVTATEPDAQGRVKLALEAAAYHSAGVRGPFAIVDA